MSESEQAPATTAPRWRALERNERRVAGVLAEKAKTTPDNYPLTLNSLINGCNQKSNRFPQMQLDESQVSDALDGLRRAGAIALIQGDSRVEKYRHLLYDWLGVDKAELAVMTELLLRGAQTLGELRSRAARMEPMPDLGALQQIVDRLRQKNLVISLTPAGRGAIVTHNLYQPQELTKVRAEVAAGEGGAAEGSALPAPVAGPGSAGGSPHELPPTRVGATARAGEVASGGPTPPAAVLGAIDQIRQELASLKREVAEVREQSEAAIQSLGRRVDELESQLGG